MQRVNGGGEINSTRVELFPKSGDRDGKYSSIETFLGAEDARGGELSGLGVGYRGTSRELIIPCEGPIFLSLLKIAKTGIFTPAIFLLGGTGSDSNLNASCWMLCFSYHIILGPSYIIMIPNIIMLGVACSQHSVRRLAPSMLTFGALLLKLDWGSYQGIRLQFGQRNPFPCSHVRCWDVDTVHLMRVILPPMREGLPSQLSSTKPNVSFAKKIHTQRIGA